MRAFVTGGTGFIGAHVVRALLARGDEVRCLVRPNSQARNLEGLDVVRVEGDVLDPPSLRAGIVGCAQVYHCAADYRLYVRDPHELVRTNVEGTDNVLRVAANVGIDRLVHTSTVGALGLTQDGSPATEQTPVTVRDMVGHYKRSKYDAERVAEKWAARGLDLVIVNPSAPVGEYDVKPTPTGRIVVDFLNRRLPAYVDTGLNVVDVRDVAEGHLLAAEYGRSGDRYILGHRNMSLRAILEALADVTGIPAPRVRMPHWVAVGAAAVDTALARLTGGQPRVALEAARMASHPMYFDASKAVRDLGLPQNPVEQALERAVAWFRDNGYVDN